MLLNNITIFPAQIKIINDDKSSHLDNVQNFKLKEKFRNNNTCQITQQKNCQRIYNWQRS